MNRESKSRWKYLAVLFGGMLVVSFGTTSQAAELHIGRGSGTIRPREPVALSGQTHTRIARNVESEVTATALALESTQGDQSRDQAIMVACDLVAIREGILEKV